MASSFRYNIQVPIRKIGGPSVAVSDQVGDLGPAGCRGGEGSHDAESQKKDTHV